MLRNRLYYLFKPLLPRGFRLAIRRWWTTRQMHRVSGTWPIMPGSERIPIDWEGWPEGKKFAFVLTHDVESQEGLDRVRDLMRLEMELGFRSSFNFIPEGSYKVSAELREELIGNGFEVGVHDLKHDGTLFRSFHQFQQRASRINRYLKEWGATGFRSGFMFNDLDWFHELEIGYDASTFDTDPFEPQPEGRHTIFPFFVARSAVGKKNTRGGYVELPYTLPQDSTLFLLLNETTPQIWLNKLDWIAKHGGMALVNVHPDYLRFGSTPETKHTYDVAQYRVFLEHARAKYHDEMWQALPREVAWHVRGICNGSVGSSGKRIGMVTYSSYESDNRVMRYAEALAARGDHVDVFALRKSAEMPYQEQIKGVNVYRIQDRFGKAERSKLDYLIRLLRFQFAASRHLRWRQREQPYDLLHIHNMPDFLIFAGRYAKAGGARLILDIHDIVPEFFSSKFKGNSDGLLVRALKHVERWSAQYADHVIISNDLWREKYATRTGADGKCSVYINHVDADIFSLRPKTRTDDKFIILFPGGLYWHQGVDIAIRAFAEVCVKFPRAEFHIYGDGDTKAGLIALATELGLVERVRFFKPVSTREIARVMAEADLGVVPKRADSFGNEAYSTKIMEFMSMGVPVVIAETRIDRYYFDDSVVRFFESGNVHALAEAFLELLGDALLRQEMAQRAKAYAARNSWDNHRANYFALVDRLCAGKTIVPRIEVTESTHSVLASK